MSIIFQTRFPTGSLATDFPEAYLPPIHLISGRGIDGGNAVTCSDNYLYKTISAYGSLNYANLTFRIQWGVDGIPVGDAGIAQFTDPLSVNSGDGSSFVTNLVMNSAGAIGIKTFDGSSYLPVSYSPPGVLIYDGRMNGIQVTFALPDHKTLNFNVVVNNISVLTGTHVANATVNGFASCGIPIHCWGYLSGSGPPHPPGTGCTERAYIVAFNILNHWNFHALMTSLAEIQVENTVNIISYPPCNAVNADKMNGCTPIIVIPDFSGLYKITENDIIARRHDVYYDAPTHGILAKKVPDPTIRTALIGD